MRAFGICIFKRAMLAVWPLTATVATLDLWKKGTLQQTLTD